MKFQQIKSIIKVLKVKIKYKGVTLSLKQNIEGLLKLSVHGDGTICIGDCGNFRNGTQLISEGKLIIGKHFFCNQNVSITCMNDIRIGDYVEIANNVVIVDHDHDYRSRNHGEYTFGKVIVGNNVWIGANVVILRNTTIGDNVVIGAGSIVSGQIPNNTVYYQKRDTVIKPFQM